MRLTILSNDKTEYFLGLVGNHGLCFTKDLLIAIKLGIFREDYQSILLECGAYCDITDRNSFFFPTHQDAEQTVEALEPYLIMKKLME